MAAEITGKELLAKMRNKEDFLLLDVRSSGAYARGHLAGALSMPFAEANPAYVQPHALADQPIVVYCYIGVASAKVADMLVQAGFTNVKSLAGGHTAWRFLRGRPRDERS